MKKYYNNALKRLYVEGQSLTIKKDNVLFSGIPDEEQLRELGFEEYVEPTPEPLSEEEIERINNQNRMSEILSKLQSMDYLTSKFIDGEDMSEYGDWQAERKALREEYRQLEEKIDTL